MSPRALATLIVLSIVLVGDAWASDQAEGTGYSLRLPDGFTKQFDSCDGGG